MVRRQRRTDTVSPTLRDFGEPGHTACPVRRSPGSGPPSARPGSYQTFIPRRRMSAMTASMPFLSMVLIPLVLKVRVT